MSEPTEIERVENVPEDDYRTTCRVCGRPITVYFNGGELDTRRCCGLSYGLESRGVDFVVYRPRTP